MVIGRFRFLVIAIAVVIIAGFAFSALRSGCCTPASTNSPAK